MLGSLSKLLLRVSRGEGGFTAVEMIVGTPNIPGQLRTAGGYASIISTRLPCKWFRLVEMNPFRTLASSGRGSLLLETIVAVTVFSMVGTAVLAGLSTAYTSGARVETQSVAENIARNQMESVFSQPYRSPSQTPYPTIGVPTGYGVSVSAEDVNPAAPDPDIERVIVTVSRDGQDILVLTSLAFNE